MKHFFLIFLSVLIFATSCSKIKSKTKESINKSGEMIGKSATEFLEGVSEGIDKTLECELRLSQELKDRGVDTGKFSIASNDGGNRNRMELYLIFEKIIKDEIFVKVYDKNGLEIGRSRLAIDEPAGAAGYYDIVFDDRTHIELRSVIIVDL